eukprot:CAMPEP_0203757006 /NCGR_PEP_ID=MMETSP0098-20131031/10177_1 /ASSEMBLY_ACC=CAM_ASM_000208 /TAXON_ID=96639 /ORGANISM=" , Strain NY0313808BC1" /LENGTH=193 /DNA_ID=CAMNT_0050649093 /DNA_START=372 /DNA_END=953 /DNA_ORIENTATION=+
MSSSSTGGPKDDTKKKKRNQKRQISRYDEKEKQHDTAKGAGGDGDIPAKRRHRYSAKEEKRAARYAKVMFFERIKLERRVKYVLNAIEKGDTSSDMLEQKKTLLDDLRYIKFFPRGQKYISLFAKDLAPAVGEKRKKLREEALEYASRTYKGDDKAMTSFIKRKQRAKTGGKAQKQVDVAPTPLEDEEDDFLL